MAVQCVLAGKGKDDVFTAIYGETTFDKVSKAYNEKKVVQVIYQNRIYYLDNTTSGTVFSFISTFNDQNNEVKHYIITLTSEDIWSRPSLQSSTPAIHANTHTKNGTDPLAPADIGAMELSESVLKQSGEDITSQVAQALSKNLVPFSGGTMTGLLNVLTPVGDSNATTKKYVDDALSEKIGMDGIGDLHVWKKTVGSTVTYPVSTNRNAYQEGSDAKPAGYTLGDVVSGLFLAGSPAGGIHWQYSDSIIVQDNGGLLLDNPSEVLNAGTSSGGKLSSLLGKFARLISNGSIPSTNPFYNGAYVYIPADAIITSGIQIDRYQPVTGHAAIPAGTTIEYLGCLGEKVSIKTGTYIGTGLYGASNPVTISPGFRPRFVLVYGYNRGAYLFDGLSYVNLVNHGGLMLDKITWKPDSVSWYSDNGANAQANEITMKYSYFVLG